MTSLLDSLKKGRLYYDGACGTYLQAQGLEAGALPELLNIDAPEVIVDMHRAYLKSGADIILTNTFGANRFKFSDDHVSVETVVAAAVANGKAAVNLEGHGYVSLDIGPLGKILAPLGDVPFEDAYDCFKEIVLAGAAAGADLITIETMSDTYEIKAALLAAKENSDLPVFVTAAFQEDGRLLTGCDMDAFVEMTTALGADAIGMNCSFGPVQTLPLMEKMTSLATIPVIVSPNAGLPSIKDGKTTYDIDAEAFSDYMIQFAEMGVGVLGGCCGTLPAYIEKTVEKTRAIDVTPPKGRPRSAVSSYTHVVDFDEKPVMIGERLNPTGKKYLQQALKDRHTSAVLAIALEEEEDGAHVLDVNVGVPGLDEVAVLPEIIRALQGVCDLPLAIDTSNPDAMEAAARIYNGRPLLNSVSGKKSTMDAVFPIAKKYGGLCVALLLDDEGIPKTVEKRMAIVDAILEEGARYGLGPEAFLFDPLAMTISSQKDGAVVVLETLRRLKARGLHSTLGVSNISFGLPNRELINSNFYAMCLAAGLSAGIVNPSSALMQKAYKSSMALLGCDPDFSDFIAAFTEEEKTAAHAGDRDLSYAIEKGLSKDAKDMTVALLSDHSPIDIINGYLVPSLDKVGRGFEEKTLFLPQLLRAADAAAAAFTVIRAKMDEEGNVAENKGRILVATVKGDIHDIGKNIVKALLENYGFDILDLGKDVSPEKIVASVKEEHIPLVGLSALMTTTVPFMEETIDLLKKQAPDTKVMVGGAVLTEDYAQEIGAHVYCKDAMASVRFAETFFEDK